MDNKVTMQKKSANGAKHSGKPYRIPLQYMGQHSQKSATLPNGGASVKIDISDKAKAIAALSEELKEVEALQLKVGEQMAAMMFDQVRLAEKCRALNRSMEALLK